MYLAAKLTSHDGYNFFPPGVDFKEHNIHAASGTISVRVPEVYLSQCPWPKKRGPHFTPPYANTLRKWNTRACSFIYFIICQLDACDNERNKVNSRRNEYAHPGNQKQTCWSINMRMLNLFGNTSVVNCCKWFNSTALNQSLKLSNIYNFHPMLSLTHILK